MAECSYSPGQDIWWYRSIRGGYGGRYKLSAKFIRFAGTKMAIINSGIQDRRVPLSVIAPKEEAK